MYFGSKRKSAARRLKLRDRIISMLLAVSLLCGNPIVLPTGAAELVAYCEIEEHSHSEECYTTERVLTCGVTQDNHVHSEACKQTEKTLTCTIVEQVHEHTDACYTTTTNLTCTEHVHTADCAQLTCTDEGHAHTDACYAYTCESPNSTHQHTDSCYTTESVLKCDYHQHTDECYTTTEVNTCGVTQDNHTHSDACYGGEKTLSCTQEEHTHTSACYSNPEADLETADDWKDTLPKEDDFTGTWAKDLLAVAESQLGYKESDKNYQVAEDGETPMGYNRYGAWYSSYTQDENQPYAPWNVIFLFFSIYYSGISDFPLEETCADWVESLDYYDLYREVGKTYPVSEEDTEGEAYTPNPGDLVFTDTGADGVADRVGIVSEWKEDLLTGKTTLTAIEGDVDGAVAEVTYDLSDTEAAAAAEAGEDPQPQILGYADMTQAQADMDPDSVASTLGTNTPTVYFAVPIAWTNAGHTIKVFVRCGAEGDGFNKTYLLEMNDTGEKDSSGRKIYKYTFTLDECPYGGFYELYFQAFNSAWVCEYRAINSSWKDSGDIDGKILTPSSTITSDYSSNGSWSTYSGGSSSGGSTGGSTGTIVDIKTTTFEPAADVLYVDSTFYDYYTDYELNGYNRDTNTTAFSESHDTWVTFCNFNTTLSNYYRNNGVTIPLYVGHFQPEWGDWGYTFASAGLSLYGFKDGNAYGTSSTNQKYFMSVNNSYMASDSTPTSNLTNYAAQGLVNSRVGSEGPLTSNGEITLPFFDSSFLLANDLGYVYQNVSFPFTKVDTDSDGVAYWTFDSATTTVEMKQDTATGDYFLEDVGNQGWAKNVNSASKAEGVSTTYGFFPFNSGSTSCNANTYNYGFGCRLDIPFRLTEDGTVLNNSNTAIPITFEFSGDDDVWVFIDGQLVLDIGGSHGKVDGKINFRDKTAYVSAAKINPGTNNTGSNGSKTTSFTLSGSNTEEHILTMFYMERGMWESNMKLTFNFPDENLLVVEKQVDTAAVNEMFEDSFENQDLFTFNIKTLATHFGTKAASAGGPDQKTAINVDLSSCILTSQSDITFESKDIGGKSGIHWYTNIADATGEYRDRRYGEIDLTQAYSMGGYETLDLEFYYDYTDTPGLSYIFIQLLDGSGNVVSVTGSHNGYPGFANRTVGSVTMGNKQWISISLDLDDLLSSADASVRYIRLGHDYPRDVYFSNISFQPEQVVDNTTVGFVLPQDEIPDYGSATSGQLEIPVNAVYTSSDGSTYRIGSSGTFVLQDGESVTFSDQFRRGSYMYLEEQASYLYETTWAMYEGTNEKLVTTSTVTDSSTVTGGGKAMPGSDTRIVTDGRIENIGLLTGETGGTNKYQSTGKAASPSPGNTFVFRHYTDPDNTSVTTKLKVVYTNTIKTGTLTIKKEQATSSQENLGTQPFTFYVVFHNVGGMSLESAPIIAGPYTLTAGNSTTITGIPLGTWYKIHEVKAKDSNKQDIILENVNYNLQAYGTGTLLPSSDTLTVGSDTFDTYSVEGLIPTTGGTDVTFTFNNSRKSVVDLTVNKVWSTTGTVTLPTSIYVQLQSRTNGENWTAVKDYKKVQLAPGYNESWNTYTYTFENLDKYASDNTTEYQYRVVELDSKGKVIDADGTVTIGGDEFTVSYGTSGKAELVSGTTNKYSQTITNTVIPTVKLEITKLDATDQTKKLEGVVFKLEKKDDTAFTANATTDSNGIATFADLKAGTYTLTETKTAEGYSLLKSAITVVIANDGSSATVDGKDATITTGTDGVKTIELTIYNKKNLSMPSTGGVYGFEYWILGGLCITAVPLLLYTLFGFKKGGKYRRR